MGLNPIRFKFFYFWLAIYADWWKHFHCLLLSVRKCFMGLNPIKIWILLPQWAQIRGSVLSKGEVIQKHEVLLTEKERNAWTKWRFEENQNSVGLLLWSCIVMGFLRWSCSKELLSSLTMTGLLELKVFLMYDEKESSQLVLTCQ